MTEPTPHLNEAALADFLSGALPAAELARCEQHLDGCAACVELIASTGRALAKLGPARVTPSQAIDTPREAASSLPLARGASVGRYLVLEQLGVGGMGVVYAAYDSELQRRVAIKLLHPGDADREQLRGRVVREAQALARLSHPHVVAVYEAGAHGNEVFVALELIDGSTLRDWLSQKPRSWREIVDAYTQAARGLMAAHAVGIVHRDFKPDNALIGRDGRVRVTDFGLARLFSEEGARAPDEAAVSRLTATGALLGSPAYMAPEQMDGAAADARADQFSFSVALFEALYGERPFAGETVFALRQSIKAGQIREGKKSAPAWVRRVVVRGLAADPAQRFPSMQALLDQLGRDPSARVRRLLFAAAALGIAAIAVGEGRVFFRQRAQLCSGGAAEVAAVWNPQRRAAIERAFLASKLPFAGDALASVSNALDLYSSAWASTQKSSCEATRLRGEQSEELLDLRADCLGRRLSEESAMIDLFTKADAKIVENAARAANALTPLESCASAEALRAVPPPPAADREAVKAMRESIARADVLQRAGKYGDGAELAKKNLEGARALGFAPLTAEALSSLGAIELELGDPQATRATLTEAVTVAEATRQPLLAARALINLTQLIGDKMKKADEGRQLAAHAQALLDAYGGSGEQRIRLLLMDTWINDAAGNYPAALEFGKQALALAENDQEPGHENLLASAANSEGETLREMERYADALVMHTRARDVYEKAFGSTHPRVALALNNLAGDLKLLGRVPEAIAAWQRALEIREKALGPDHPDVAATLSNLSQVHFNLHQLPEAKAEADRALAIKEKVYGPQSPAIAYALSTLADIAQSENHTEEAITLARREHAVRLAGLGPEHSLTLLSAMHIGRLLDIGGHTDEAVAILLPASASCEKVLGPEQILTAALLGTAGIAQMHAGNTAAATETLNRALPLMKKHPADIPAGLSQTSLALAQLTWPKDHARGLQLGEDAKAYAISGGAGDQGEQQMAEQWLAAHAKK